MYLIDKFLNQITMYRLTLYYLIALVGIAVIFGFTHTILYNPFDILISATLAIISCYIANVILAKILGAVTNVESVLITALILTLIVPTTFPKAIPFIIGASVLAMLTKYVATVNKQHVFNPAAASVAAIALLSPEHVANWWVGNQAILPFVLVGGLLLMRKIQREKMVLTFLGTVFGLVAVYSLWFQGSLTSVFNAWKILFLDSAVFFFAFIMLTEPLTSPSTKFWRQIYAVLIAFLYTTPQLRFVFIFSPELALCVGNFFTLFVNPKYRLHAPLLWKKEIGKGTYAFAFTKPQDFKFTPGQYLEWTLQHKNPDSRGNRRYFSIASSPKEEELIMTVRFYDPPSSYKKNLKELQNGDKIVAASLSGDFILPKDSKKKLVFIAGGVGIAPFRSMIQALLERKEKRDIVMFFSNREKEEIVFSDLFAKALQNGVKTIYTLTDMEKIPPDWQGEKGYITAEMIQKYVPDFKSRTFYLSGPQLMVQRFEKMLKEMGVSSSQVVKDFFPGYSEA